MKIDNDGDSSSGIDVEDVTAHTNMEAEIRRKKARIQQVIKPVYDMERKNKIERMKMA